MSSKPLVVMKFGGSSLANSKYINRVASLIKATKNQGYSPVVVVSAMYGDTDRLIGLGSSVSDDGHSHSEAFDFLVSAGEHVSAGLLCMALEKIDCKARPKNALQAGIQLSVSDQEIPSIIFDRINIQRDVEDKVVQVITGFQATNANHRITTLGRGGSDLSAVALAAELECECRIFTDVSGVYSVDPKLYPNAKRISRVPIDMMRFMSRFGAKVLQYKALAYADYKQVPLRVMSTFSPDEGSQVVYNGIASSHRLAVQFLDDQSYFKVKASADDLLRFDQRLTLMDQAILCSKSDTQSLSVVCDRSNANDIRTFIQHGDGIESFEQKQVALVTVIGSNDLAGLPERLHLAMDVFHSKQVTSFVVDMAEKMNVIDLLVSRLELLESSKQVERA